MKLTIELEDPVDVELYTHAAGYASALWDIKQRVRERMKYGDLSESVYSELETLRQYVYELCQTYHLPED